ncbi:inositol monophosphatase 1-like [Mizuhopecten yessoensis]|uniref:Inositol-1-monophosphatase n=1 Tax=Mizuhopecten yessoensis TaxID=6573 RepID=A0A210QXL8_MIZYE|nr:inositol monophosphatase 1-like [Mizuhopecten yessoensis]XP_021347025.1 inositol monophosphatase 1-like [Mizuhopecten yessoensis]OWF53509.1 Inositol monophosphatase 1 [Mizuhopecten yessoensis]
MDHDLKDYLKTAVEVARNAGDMVKKAYDVDKSVVTKECYADLVTETDQAVERMIIKSLAEKYPTHKFIGEESVAEGKKCDWTDAPTWIIDPIDGTSNFVHSIAHNCVCIGLGINRKIVVGVVYLPITNHMYTAVKGQGAFCNDQKISVSKTSDLKNAVVYTEAGNSRQPDSVLTKIDNMKNIVFASHGIRCLGSAAINMCMVAQGSGDAYIEYGIHIWDIAASGIIVEEAGGVLMDPSGSEVDFLSRGVLCACSRSIAIEISKIIKPVEFERD